MRLGIGVLTAGGYQYQVPTAFVRSLFSLHSVILRGQTSVTSNYLYWESKFPIDAGRNSIIKRARADRVDKVLFLDCDHEFEADAVVRLIESPHPIVTGRYHVRQPPYHPTLYVLPKGDYVKGQFKPVHYGRGEFPVHRCGAGALAVTMPVLEQIGHPWFRYQSNGESEAELDVSEDFWFCQRAYEEGYTIMADWDAELGHVVQGTVTGQWHADYLRTMEAAVEAGEPLDKELVAIGYPDGYRLPSGHVIEDYYGASHPVTADA